MWSDFGRLRAALVGLLVGTAILFIVGIALEQGQRASPGTQGAEVAEPASSSEAGESSGHSEAGEGAEGQGQAQGHSETSKASEERLLGIDYEAPLFIAFAVITPLVLAGLIFLRPTRWVLGLAGLFGLAFAALDTLEVWHQLNEGQALIALIAVVLVFGHLLVAGISGRLAMLRLAMT